MPRTKACCHANKAINANSEIAGRAQADPTPIALEVLHVLDAHIHFTEAFARCQICDRHYLLETVDLDTQAQLLRVSLLDKDATQRTIRALRQGSCDVTRPRNEVFSTSSQGVALDQWLLMRNGEFERWVPALPDVPASLSWRDLHQPGELLDQLAPKR